MSRLSATLIRILTPAAGFVMLWEGLLDAMLVDEMGKEQSDDVTAFLATECLKVSCTERSTCLA